MHNKELEKYIDFVLSIALNKCRNLDDARDLTQDTLISALKYLSVGKLITDYKAFLISILNRRFYDSLRKKYKLPTVCFDTLPEMAYEKDDFNSIYDTSDAEELRCQIAFLSKLYREVIVRHYMNGESVEKIANELNIPSGTVKSRLSSGRDQIKKGFNNMDTYSKQSYEPQVLYIGISGTRGLNGEPSSITDNNAIIQNLLILAYNEPITETELAKAIGIPAAYIESIIDTLVREELMKKVGNRVYTDFIIYSPDENENSILPQEKLINENFNILWNPIRTSLEKLKNLDFYKNFTEKQKSKLEYYFLMFTLAKCFFGTGSKIYDNTHIYPKRPNGGEWIASGSAYPQNFDHENTKIHKYSWSGERINCLNDILGTKEIVLRVFDTPLEKQRYYHTKYNLDDAGIAQMLYIINENIKPGSTAINPMFFENIPYLSECGVVDIVNGKPAVDIPVVRKHEFEQLAQITWQTVDEFIPLCLPFLTEHLKNAKTKIPKHLMSVPEQKQYLMAMSSLSMLMIYNAKDRGYILNNVDFPCPPMVLVTEK